MSLLHRRNGQFLLFRNVPRFLLLTTAACLLATGTGLSQDAAPAATPAQSGDKATASPQTMTMQTPAPAKEKKESRKQLKRDQKVIVSKDTKKMEQNKKAKQANQLAGVDLKLPDKELYDKAMASMKKARFDVARLELQTLLNTYPDSQFQMRAKLGLADSWFREGGSAALAQAEAEYKDFQTFFPNVPEAAEAQMRVADIYYRQMDKPDRDFTDAAQAEVEYRTMILQYPDSTLVPQAKQKLREVQEVLATRQADIAAFYMTHENWPAVIARYQTLVDTYPLYSHSDDALIALGDAYVAEANRAGLMHLNEAAKSRVMKAYNDEAAAAYDLVITRYPSMDHVEDARDRLQQMHYPVPEPTREAIAESETLTTSRKSVTLSDRAKVLVLHRPDTVEAARVGEPTMVSPTVTTAPGVIKQMVGTFNTAMNPQAAAVTTSATTPASPSDATAPASAASTTPVAPAGPVQLEDIPATGGANASGDSSVTTGKAAPSQPSGPSGTGVGLSVVSHPADTTTTDTTTPDPNGGLKAIGPANTAPLPGIEKPTAAPDTVNDVAGVATPSAAIKSSKPVEDKNTESNSKKKKKGLKKIIP